MSTDDEAKLAEKRFTYHIYKAVFFKLRHCEMSRLRDEYTG